MTVYDHVEKLEAAGHVVAGYNFDNNELSAIVIDGDLTCRIVLGTISVLEKTETKGEEVMEEKTETKTQKTVGDDLIGSLLDQVAGRIREFRSLVGVQPEMPNIGGPTYAIAHHRSRGDELQALALTVDKIRELILTNDAISKSEKK